MSDRVPDQIEPIRRDVERLATELDVALARLEGLEGATEWKLRSRLMRLEAEYLLANRPAPEPTVRQRFLAGCRALLAFLADVLGKLAPVVTPVVIAVVGYQLTGTYAALLELRRVEVAEQQLTLETVKSLEQQFKEFAKENIGYDEARAIAERIVLFGPVAIAPLVAQLSGVTDAQEPRAKAIAHALKMTAISPTQLPRLCGVLRGATLPGRNAVLGSIGLRIAEDLMTTVSCE